MTHITRRDWAMAAVTAALAASQSRASAQSRSNVVDRVQHLERYLHYDVFTDRPHTGNQLAVFMEPAALAVETMAAMTREMNYSECTFVFPPIASGTDVQLRIFGRAGEMPFAGHPVIGSTFALADEGRIPAGRSEFTLGLGIGPTPVALEWERGQLRFAWMSQQRPVYGASLKASASLASAMGIAVDQCVPGLPIQEVSCGSPFFFAPLTTRAAVDAVQMNSRELETVFKPVGGQRRGILVFTTEVGADRATVYSRMISASGLEDPATGSASGPLGCYLVYHGLVPTAATVDIVSAQGVKMGRPSRIHIRLDTSGREIQHVQVGGTSVLVGDGRLRSA